MLSSISYTLTELRGVLEHPEHPPGYATALIQGQVTTRVLEYTIALHMAC